MRPTLPRLPMLKMMRTPTFLLAALGLSVGLAFGQTAADPLDACAAQKDDAARLACFDRQMALRHGGQRTGAQAGEAGGPTQPASAHPDVNQAQVRTSVPLPQTAPRLTPPTQPEPPSQMPQPQAAQPPVVQPQATQGHGQTAVAPPPGQVTPPPPPDPNYGLQLKRQAPAAVSATVARLVPVSATEYAFQLDNGQIWQQTDGRPGLIVRVNDRVTIKPGTFGDFFFTTPDRQRIRVKRIH